MNDTPSPPDSPPILPSTVPPEPAAPRRWRWRVHFLLIASYVAVITAHGMIDSGPRAPAFENSRDLVVVCSVELSIFGVVMAVACLVSRPTRDDLLLRWRGRIRPILQGIAYSLALRLTIGVLTALVLGFVVITRLMPEESLKEFVSNNRPNVEAIVDVAALRNNPFYFWFTVTFVSFILGGLREELWRSAFLAGLRRLWPARFGSTGGQIAGVGIAALLFGSAHLQMGVVAGVLAALLGFGLGVIMVCHRSIWPAVIAHGFFDATSLAMIPFVLSNSPTQG